MDDRTFVWNTDVHLQITSLTARLRDLAGLGGRPERPLHVSDLWGTGDPLAPSVVSHHWALDGETLSFEATIRDVRYVFHLEPLQDAAGNVVGVTGRAADVRSEETPIQPRALLEAERSAGVGSWYVDLRTDAVSFSPGLALLLGIDRNASTLDIRAFDHPDDRDEIAHAIERQERDDGAYTCDHRILCNSRMRVVRERSRTILDERGLAIARVGTLLDITDFKEREAELTSRAHYDTLTQLPNRALLEERLAASVRRCERQQQRCGVYFLDLDSFKAINDTHGHGIGDRLLTCVGDRLSRHVRASDTVARLGGDEFVILIEDLPSDEAAIDAGRKLLHSFDEPFHIDDRPFAISTSIGIATYPTSSSEPSELIPIADREMYIVKRNGGHGVKFATKLRDDLSPLSVSTRALEPRPLKEALM